MAEQGAWAAFGGAPAPAAPPQQAPSAAAAAEVPPSAGTDAGAWAAFGRPPVAQAAQPPPPSPEDPTGAAADMGWTPGTPPSAGARVLGAAVEGWRGPPFLTPKAKAAAEAENQKTLLGRYVVSPMVAASEVPFRALNALGGAVGQGAYEAGSAISGPSGGRSAYMINQLLPALAAFPEVPRVAETSPAPAGPRFVQEHYGEGTPANPLAAQPQLPPPADIPPNAARPPAVPINEAAQPAAAAPAFMPPRPQAATPAGVPQPAARATPATPETPQPAGAQVTPSATSALTPQQTAAYRSTAEGTKLIEPQQPGMADRNQYVSGVDVNQAEIEQNAATSRELKAIGIAQPEVTQEAREITTRNSEARGQHFDQAVGSPVDVANAKAAMAERDQTELGTAFAGKTEADALPVVDAGKTILASPEGVRPLVRNVVNSVMKELYDADGNLHSDPEMLYGVRKHIDDLINEQDAAGKPKNIRAMAALLQMKGAVTDAIDQAAPGFKDYLARHAVDAQKIDEMTVLQGHRSGLFNAQNLMTYNGVQRMMKNIVDSRAAPGVNEYKSISPETMGRLFALRDDLRRSASAMELARAPGSDTAPNLLDFVKGLAAHPDTQATVAAWLLGPAGPVISSGLRRMLMPIAARRAATTQTARGMEMLHPQNALLPPPQP